jgi:dolichyl-phosphate-mannose--protein O-mannosyl transferase
MHREKKMTNKQKWVISAWSVFAVAIIFNPITFKITNILRDLSPVFETINNKGQITMWGWCLHWLVFFLAIRVMMSVKLPGA